MGKKFRSLFTRKLWLAGMLLVMLTAAACDRVGWHKKIYKVGILTSFEPFMAIADGFKKGMTELGYIEGKNIIYDTHVMSHDPQVGTSCIRNFLQEKVDLIFTFPTEASVLAHQATKGTDTPVVFAMAGMEGNHLVDSVSHPGGNTTGVRFPGWDNSIKHLELLCDLKPDLKRVWVTYDRDYPNSPLVLPLLRSAAKEMGITLVEAPNKTAEDVRDDLRQLEASGNVNIDAILLLPEFLSQSREVFSVVLPFSKKHRIPIGGGVPYTTESGAIFTLMPEEEDMGRLAALLADKILKGDSPATTPVMTPENHLWFNYKAAQEMGLNVPEGLLSQVDVLIRE